jgi:uncharacterized protein YcfJ
MNAIKPPSIVLGGMSPVLLGACNEDGEVAQASAGKTSREVCTEQVVTRQKPVKDENRVIGTVTGAVAGGYAGNRVQKSMQKNATVETTEVVCRTVYD